MSFPRKRESTVTNLRTFNLRRSTGIRTQPAEVLKGGAAAVLTSKGVSLSVLTSRRSRRAEMLLVEASPAFLLFEGVLDPTRVGEGHAVQLVDATSIGLYRQGDVDEALDHDHGDVPQADTVYVLGLPAALELDPIHVDADDGIVMPCGLGDGSQM